MALPPEGTPILDMLRQNTDADFARLMRDSVPIHLTPPALGNPLNSAARAALYVPAGRIPYDSETSDMGRDSYPVHYTHRLAFDIDIPEHPRCRSVVHDGGTVTGRVGLRTPNFADIESRILADMSREIDRSMLTSLVVNNPPDAAVPGPTAAEAVAMLAAAMRRTGISMAAMDQMMSPGTLTGAELAAAYGADPEVETPPPAPVNAPRPTRGRRRMVR